MTEEIWSYGGVAGASAVTEDLDAAVAILRAAAASMDDAARAAGTAAVRGVMVEGAAPVAGAPAHAAAVVAAELESLAASLAAAAQEYLDAEAAALAAVRGTSLGERAEDVGSIVGWTAGWTVTVAAMLNPWSLVIGPRRVVGALAPSGPPTTTALVDEPATQRALSVLDPIYVGLVQALAAALRAAESLEPRVTAVDRGDSWTRPAAGSLATMMRRLAGVEARADGSVLIETSVAPTGRRIHTVYIPGTEDWTVWDPNPADLQANPASVTGGVTDASLTVVRALEAHGVTPGEEVMLVGHSQGGMVAHVVAGATGGLAPGAPRLNVTQVVTAGSPTGRLGLPPRASALHLENSRDLVTGLDGRRNPDTPHRVTVVHDRREDPDASDPSETLAQAHDLRGYADTAGRVDAGLTRSTEDWREGASDFLRPGEVTATVYRPVLPLEISGAGPQAQRR